jgi:hypothetical protein
MNENADSRVPDLTLERYHLKELSAPAMARLDRRLQDDEALRRRLAVLIEDDAQLRASGRLAILSDRVQRSRAAPGKAERRQSWAAIPRWAVLAGAATAVLLVLVFPRMTTFTVNDTERIKGLQPSLELYRRVGDGSETLAEGAAARPGDLIRVGYRAAGRSYGVILSIDGRGQVTLHLPGSGEHAAPLRREATVLLDQAFELDDAPRYERFYFVTSNQPFTIAPIVAAARRVTAGGGHTAPPLALGAGFEQTVRSLLKESQP